MHLDKVSYLDKAYFQLQIILVLMVLSSVQAHLYCGGKRVNVLLYLSQYERCFTSVLKINQPSRR